MGEIGICAYKLHLMQQYEKIKLLTHDVGILLIPRIFQAFPTPPLVTTHFHFPGPMTLLLWTYSRHTPSQLCTVIVQFTRCIDANGDRQLRTLGPDCHILVLVLVLPLGIWAAGLCITREAQTCQRLTNATRRPIEDTLGREAEVLVEKCVKFN